MEEAKSVKALETPLQKLNLNSNTNSNPNPNPKSSQLIPTVKFSGLPRQKKEPPSLQSMCLGVVGKHFEDIIEDLSEISVSFPADIKMALAAIARRRKLLNDDVVVSLAENSWEILDISGSNVSDIGLAKVAEKCKYLRAVDISQCDSITPDGVYDLVRRCNSLETLRLGGCPRSDNTARRSLGIFKPKINNVEGDSWEELDTEEIVDGAQSLRWLLWPKIDKDSLESLSTECPRIIVNPKPSPFGFRGIKVPEEAIPNIALDHMVIKDIDPSTWAVCGFTPRPSFPSHSSPAVCGFTPRPSFPSHSRPTELSMAEKFRLAFVERDTRLAPKRAKNARQHERRAKRDYVMMSTHAKSIALASQASKSLQSRN